jgi:hypothetical protein
MPPLRSSTCGWNLFGVEATGNMQDENLNGFGSTPSNFGMLKRNPAMTKQSEFYDFRLKQNGMIVAGVSSTGYESAWREIIHYAMVYSQDDEDSQFTIEQKIGRKWVQVNLITDTGNILKERNA